MIFCPSCQAQLKGPVATCPSCAYNLSPPVSPPRTSLVRPAARPKIQCKVDLGIAIDRTGSSDRFKTGIPMTCEIILAQLTAKARGVTCSVRTHGDLDENQDSVLHTDCGTPDQAIEDIKKITYGGGGDEKEHHLDGIETVLNQVPWTADPSRARGAILAFMTADTKPAKSGITASELGKKIKAKGLLLYLVCEPTPTLVELARAAEGLVFPITNSPDPVELQKIAAKLAESIVITTATGSTVPMTVPVS